MNKLIAKAWPLAASVLMLAAGGCATTEGYQKSLAGWVGAGEVDLIRKWGAPRQTYEAGDRRFLVFVSHNELVLPEIAPSYESRTKGNTTYTMPVGGSPAMTLTYTCTTTFELKAGRVVGSRFDGNDCRAKS